MTMLALLPLDLGPLDLGPLDLGPVGLGMVPMSVWDSISGFFATIMWPIYWAVSGLLVLFHHLWSPVLGENGGWTWVLSIVSLTVVIRAALIPLFVRQIQSSRNMQTLQPKVRELQKKYGHDREALGRETMKLYRENNANPMASCLPLLLQMPIFITLFQVINNAASGRATGKFLEDRPHLVDSLRESVLFADTFFEVRVSDKFLPFTGFTGVTIITVVMILAMSATMFYTQLQLTRKNMPPSALEGPMAQQQKMMLYLFPVIFAVGGVNFPIGVLVYWLTSNLWTTAQQFVIIKTNPTPGTPAYAEWEARQLLKGRDPNAPRGKQKAAASSRTVAGSGEVAGVTTDEPSSGVQRQQSRQQPQRQSRSQRKKKR